MLKLLILVSFIGSNLKYLQSILLHRYLDIVSRYIKKTKIWDKNKILMVGIGNREITSDSLGPKCVSSTCVNRHLHIINKEEGKYSISAIIPGVMAQTCKHPTVSGC